jgi:hypothetical protein
MTASAKAWLPRAALDDRRIRELVSATVESWSRKWFAAGALTAARFRALRRGDPWEISGWRDHGMSVALAPSAPAMIPLGLLALGGELGRHVLSEVDRDIIGRFADRMADDLANCLDQALGIQPGGDGGRGVDDALRDGGLSFAIVDGADEPVLHGAIPAAPLIAFLKDALAPARPPRAPLAKRARAVGATKVEVDVLLGETRLALGELADLVPGDVLALDRRIASGAGLALAGSQRSFASAAITDRGESVALILSPQHREI